MHINHFHIIILFLFFSKLSLGQKTPYELQGKNYTATYAECIAYYQSLDEQYNCISMVEMGQTDAGLPLHTILVNKYGQFNPKKWHQQNHAVILINNGIHPGEPDGIDASMMLVRDIVENIDDFPSNVSLAIIPIYNIGGALNRGENNRVDQDGPAAFGSRGNAQNLDLNRDFIKCDSRNARSFTEIFHWIRPTIFIDNHVSDGADYPYVMTLATTQHNKLGGVMGDYIHRQFEPALFDMMKEKGFPMIPYVNVWSKDAKLGWSQFFDAPRYSSGYAAMFHTFSFTPETHMLKPYPQRVEATYQLMYSFIEFAHSHSEELIELQKKSIEESLSQETFPIHWTLDETKYSNIEFKGYEYKTRISEVSHLPIKYYDKDAPYTTQIPFRNFYKASLQIQSPTHYIIPQGWWKVIELLKLNNVKMYPLDTDSMFKVQAYKITNYQSGNTPYESHHANSKITTETINMDYSFRKGDMLIPLQQERKRFIIETLEPQGNDSYFAWNYFDGILGQKEGYNDYAFEPIAAQYVNEHPALKADLLQKQQSDSNFAKDAEAQLDFVYKHSPYYEKGHNLYPVFRIIKNDISNSNKGIINSEDLQNKKDE
jgi:hypothetical protein